MAELIPIKKSAGFTLLEMVVALSLLIGGVLVVYSSSARMMAHIYDNQSRLVASYLAQEGVEVVRNIRDKNWSGGQSWLNGLGIGNWQVQHNSTFLTAYNGQPLRLDNGYYQYGSGPNTVFRRKITISHPGADVMNVLVEVNWPHDGGHSVKAEKFFYNWH